MKKTRVIGGVDYGKVRPNNKYSGFSGGYGAWNVYGEEYAKSLLTGLHTSLSNSASKILGGTVYYTQWQEMFESSERRKPQFNNCNHTLVKTVNYPFSCLYRGTGRYAAYGFWRMNHGTTPLVLAGRPDWGSVSSNMQAEAYHSMIPRFEGDVSMLNFIFEMKDFRDMSFAVFKHLPRVIEKYSLTGSVSVATKRLAEGHLIKSFVVDPLVMDIGQIIGQAQKLVMDAQTEFAEKGLTPNIRHFSKTLNQSQSLGAYSSVFLPDFVKILKGTKTSQKWTCTMEGDYGYTCRTDLDAFLTYWGLVPTAEAVWNAVPFSFLVDYFFSIGHSFKVMRKDPNVSYRIRQYCESVLSTTSSGLYLTNGLLEKELCWIIDDVYTSQEDRPSSAFFSGHLSSQYERVVKSPYWGPFLPRWRVPTDKQSLNTAALLRCLI